MDGREGAPALRDGGAALPGRFAAHVRQRGLIAPGERVLVAVSGGLDSMVLLHLLRFGVPELSLRLVAGHFDHAMREGSAADADWVAGVCTAWGVPLVRARADRPLRSEADARAARYAFLRRAAVERGVDRVATAHHADDQAETVLFRLIRGTGLDGLAGIRERRGRLVRPLLPFRRAELAAYADRVALRHREDPSNRLHVFARNRLRHDVMPRLEEIAPGAGGALARLAAEARAARAAWRQVTAALEAEVFAQGEEGALLLDRARLCTYHAHVRARLLRRALRRYGSHPDRAGTLAALEFINSGASGTGIDLPGGVRLEREFDRFVIRPQRGAGEHGAQRPLSIPDSRPGAGTAVVAGREVRVEWAPGRAPDGGTAAELNVDALAFPLVLRGWQPGDRIRLRGGSKKLKKVFLERRIGRDARRRAVVLADARGRVVWVPGIAVSAACEPRDGAPLFHITVTDGGLGREGRPSGRAGAAAHRLHGAGDRRTRAGDGAGDHVGVPRE